MAFKLGAVWSYRKMFARRVREGLANLRVIGSAKEGFNLAAVQGEKVVPLFALNRFVQQKDAVAYGLVKFNVQARKLMAPKAA